MLVTCLSAVSSRSREEGMEGMEVVEEEGETQLLTSPMGKCKGCGQGVQLEEEG